MAQPLSGTRMASWIINEIAVHWFHVRTTTLIGTSRPSSIDILYWQRFTWFTERDSAEIFFPIRPELNGWKVAAWCQSRRAQRSLTNATMTECFVYRHPRTWGSLEHFHLKQRRPAAKVIVYTTNTCSWHGRSLLYDDEFIYLFFNFHSNLNNSRRPKLNFFSQQVNAQLVLATAVTWPAQDTRTLFVSSLFSW